MKSPFNGSTNKIKQKITRKHYEEHKDEKYSQFVYDPDRGCDLNEFYMELINPEGEFLLIREKND